MYILLTADYSRMKIAAYSINQIILLPLFFQLHPQFDDGDGVEVVVLIFIPTTSALVSLTPHFGR